MLPTYAAKTYDIIKFIMSHETDLFKNAGNKDAVRIEKAYNLKREIIIVHISAFEKQYKPIKLAG